jgi:hypothetical protein
MDAARFAAPKSQPQKSVGHLFEWEKVPETGARWRIHGSPSAQGPKHHSRKHRPSPDANRDDSKLLHQLAQWQGTRQQTAHCRALRSVVEKFLASLGQKAHRPLGALTVRDLENFRNQSMDAGQAPKTITVEIKILRTVLNVARRQGRITVNPCRSRRIAKSRFHTRATCSRRNKCGCCLPLPMMNGKRRFSRASILARGCLT